MHNDESPCLFHIITAMHGGRQHGSCVKCLVVAPVRIIHHACATLPQPRTHCSSSAAAPRACHHPPSHNTAAAATMSSGATTTVSSRLAAGATAAERALGAGDDRTVPEAFAAVELPSRAALACRQLDRHGASRRAAVVEWEHACCISGKTDSRLTLAWPHPTFPTQ